MPFQTNTFPTDAGGCAALVTWATTQFLLGYRIQAVDVIKDGVGAFPRVLVVMQDTAPPGAPAAGAEAYRIALATVGGNVTYPVAGSYVPAGDPPTSPDLPTALLRVAPPNRYTTPWLLPLETYDQDHRILLLGENLPTLNANQQGTLITRIVVTADDLEAAALTQTFALMSPAAPGVYVLWKNLVQEFSGGTVATLVTDGGTLANLDLLMDAADVFTGATLNYAPQVTDVGTTVATLQEQANLVVTFTSTVGDIDEIDEGEAAFELWRIG